MSALPSFRAEQAVRLTLTCSAAGTASPTPGSIARALHAAFGVPGEALHEVEPGDRGVYQLALEASRARAIETPVTLTLSLPGGRGGLLAVLGRPSDPLQLQVSGWRLSGADAAPTPGSVARALPSIGLAGEELGFISPEGADLRLALPPAAELLPAATPLEVDGRELTLGRV
jgi:hypothetical protein